MDLRKPIGYFFLLLGIILGVYGLMTGDNADMYRCSLGININLIWGGVLVVFGLAMLLPALFDEQKSASQGAREEGAPVSPVAQNLPSFLASAGMVVAFFMPWMSIGGLGLAGNKLGEIGNKGQLAWIVLILAAITAVFHFVGPKRALNIVTGIVPYGLLIYFASEVGSDLFRNLGIGAWMTLGCGLVLIFAPVKALSRP